MRTVSSSSLMRHPGLQRPSAGPAVSCLNRFGWCSSFSARIPFPSFSEYRMLSQRYEVANNGNISPVEEDLEVKYDEDISLDSNSPMTMEMVIADLQVTGSNNSNDIVKRVIVPERPTIDTSSTPQENVGAMEEMGNSNTYSKLRRLVARPEDVTALVEAQTKLARQSEELREAKSEILRQDHEIKELRSKLELRDLDLRSMRAQLLESKALGSEQEKQIKALTTELTQAGIDRAQLQEDLALTRAELDQMAIELESLADDILKSSDEELENFSEIFDDPVDKPNTRDVWPRNGVDENKPKINSNADFDAFKVNSQNASWEVLAQGIANLSRDILKDAQRDEQLFNISGIFGHIEGKKITNEMD